MGTVLSTSETKTFNLSIFDGADVTAVLKIDEEGKGYLKYYNEGLEVIEDGVFESINPTVIKHYIDTAETLCTMNYSTLWSY